VAAVRSATVTIIALDAAGGAAIIRRRRGPENDEGLAGESGAFRWKP
jgi:hypothetical protein